VRTTGRERANLLNDLRRVSNGSSAHFMSCGGTGMVEYGIMGSGSGVILPNLGRNLPDLAILFLANSKARVTVLTVKYGGENGNIRVR